VNRSPASDDCAGRACATVAAMVLLSGMMRSVAVTGRTDTLAAWCAGRQGGRWAEQTVRAAFRTPHAQRTPPAGREPARADPAEALRELTELHKRGIVTDAEFEVLRARLRV
jgi:Short C-terminal domain